MTDIIDMFFNIIKTILFSHIGEIQGEINEKQIVPEENYIVRKITHRIIWKGVYVAPKNNIERY